MAPCLKQRSPPCWIKLLLECFEEELALAKEKKGLAGADEVGRGCLAGPVFSAVAVLHYGRLLSLPASERALIRDSKTLSASQRKKALAVLEKITIAFGVAQADSREIELLGIVKATFLSMKRALCLLYKPVDFILVDGNQKIPGIEWEQRAEPKGDGKFYCIAAGSIIAKEARDQFMRKQSLQFPSYGFDQHVGYATLKHLEAIKKNGICSMHRRNFEPCSQYV